MDNETLIERFLSSKRISVCGASQDRNKYGNKVLRALQSRGFEAIPVNPKVDDIEGLQTFPSLSSIPFEFDGVSIITPPSVTLGILDEIKDLGILRIWLQPGAEDSRVIDRIQYLELDAIYGGPCILVALQWMR